MPPWCVLMPFKVDLNLEYDEESAGDNAISVNQKIKLS